MSASQVAARRYAKALYALASEAKNTEKVRSELADVASALESSTELRALLESPTFTPAVKKKTLLAVATRAGAGTVVQNFLQLLVDRSRAAMVGDVSSAYDSLAEKASGRVRAEVTTATALSDAYYAELEKALAHVVGRQVTVVRKVDPSILGGVVTRVGDTVYDGSLAHQLKEIRSEMLASAAPNAR